jgi:hypothetical protein
VHVHVHVCVRVRMCLYECVHKCASTICIHKHTYIHTRIHRLQEACVFPTEHDSSSQLSFHPLVLDAKEQKDKVGDVYICVCVGGWVIVRDFKCVYTIRHT